MKKIISSNKYRFLAAPVTIILGKVMTFLFDALLGSLYGAGTVSDAFILAYSIPTVFFDGFITAVVTCYIPFYSKIELEMTQENFRNEKDKYNSNIFFLALFIGILITICFSVFQKPILNIYAGGFTGENRSVLDYFVNVLIWSIPISASYSVFRAYLQVNNLKAISNMAQSICYFVLIIGLIVSFPMYKSLPYVGVLGYVISFIFLMLFARQKGFHFIPFISLREPYIKPFFMMMLPVILSTLVGEINSIVDKYFSSFLDSGGITSLTYGYKLSAAISGIVSASLMLIMYPILAKCAAIGDRKKMAYHLRLNYSIIYWLVIPCVIGGEFLAEPIIKLVFGHGKFNSESVAITARVFSIYLIGVLPSCMKNITNKAFYALKNSAATFWTTVISVAINIFLDFLLYEKYTYIGLAASTSAALLISAIAELYLLYRFDKELVCKEHFTALVKPVLASVAMGIIVYFTHSGLRNLISGRNALITIMSIIAGITFYIILLLTVFRKDSKEMIEYLKKSDM